MRQNKSPSVLILGYGREGRSVHRYFHQFHPQISISLADQNPTIKPEIQITGKLHLGENYLQFLKQYDLIIRSPGISLQKPELQQALARGQTITSATQIFFQECPGITIGVTGSLGKSTTTSLIAALLSTQYSDVRLVGNIGIPALDHLAGAHQNTFFAIELSSFQLEDLTISPKVAVLLNIVPEHLDRHQTFSAYLEAKANLVKHQKPEDWLIYNPQHRVLRQIVSQTPSRKIIFTLSPHPQASCFLMKNKIWVRKEKEIIPLIRRQEIPLLGEGNSENIMAAVSVALLFRVPLQKIRQALKKFQPLEHRLEFVGRYRGIDFYNDSISTLPQSTIHALKALGSRVETLLLGGYDRGIDFSPLVHFLKNTQVNYLILFPTTGAKIWQIIKKQLPQNNWPQKYFVRSMKKAIKIAFQLTSPGKICLLSPASASFGLFQDYRDRGNQFKKFVRLYGEN